MSIEAALAATDRAQAEASDPARSAWVSANAGAGKTHVLKLRVLRLLLAGTAPDRILCVTYTKAAAAEMAARVFADLAQWATEPDEALAATLKPVLGRVPSTADMARARQLFARAIETPGGLKVQTIHGFCERLLQRFPLEAGVPPGFAILDDDAALKLRRDAIDDVLRRATGRSDSALAAALSVAIAHAVDDRFDEILAAAISRRGWLAWLSRLDGDDEPGAAAARLYRKALGVRATGQAADIEREICRLIDDATIKRAAAALTASGKAYDLDIANGLAAALRATTDAARAAGLKAALLTGDGKPRSDKGGRFLTKAVRDEHPDLHPVLARARDRLYELACELQAMAVCDATLALARLALAVSQGYAERKALSAALDYEDLIERTAGLLNSSEMADWVLYKLDNGLDHILVDEAQDTSPSQWDVVSALANEFFAGDNGSDRIRTRTLFAVGDEKQSIYSFQGAAPHMFAATGERFAAAARDAGQQWSPIPLQLSFRTVVPILAAVDKVFADATRTPGVGTGSTRPQHVARRVGHAGLVEVWPPELPDEAVPAAPWSPLDETRSHPPAVRLADRIADLIKSWLDNGEMLPSIGRPVRAGDILILVRKRRPFAPRTVAALKARGIPVAGSDRLRLTDELAVKDLIALGDFLVLPEDDLALACVLKSPLFELDDDDLIAIAPGRKGTLWQALLANVARDPRYAAAADQLKAWRHDADLKPPYEFFAEVLDRCHARERLITRLGPDAADPISEFLNLALTYDDKEAPSLVGFLDWLRAGTREIKRDMEHGRDEVRIMTVHGAKGLEAPIVFLPDTMAHEGPPRDPLVDMPAPGYVDEPPLAVWRLSGAGQIAAIEAADQDRKAAAFEEANRLLYVALTRARDRLYIAGFQGKRAPPSSCWYETAVAAFQDSFERVRLPDGRELLRSASPQVAPPEKPKHAAAAAIAPEAPPAWAHAQAPRDARLSLPLAPSRLAPLETDDVGEPAEPRPLPASAPRENPAPSPVATSSDDRRFLRGTITHALLQHLPGLPSETWASAAAGFVAQRAAALPERVQTAIVAETLGLLRDKRFGAAFGPGSRAEVPIVAEIPRPGGGTGLRLTGQIDRLIVRDHEVLIIDYKTNRAPPSDVAGVPSSYLYQLAAYRLALAGIFPGRAIAAALLWTDGATLMPIPDALLDNYEQQLWRLDPANLDAGAGATLFSGD